MTGKTASIKVNILGDSKNLQGELGGAEKKLASLGAKAEGIGKKMTIGVTAPLVAGGAAAIKWAGDLEDSTALAQQVFRQNAAEMMKWSESSGKSFGIAQKDAVEYANQFGLQLQNIGKMTESESANISKQLVELAADLGSAFGTSSTEAYEALRGALTGEYEMLKKYAIVINETALKQEYANLTGAESVGVLDAQQKQQAALSLIMQQTSKIQGDFSRNIDGTTNAMKVAQATGQELATNLGTALLPAFNTAMRGAQGVVDMFLSLPDPAQKAVAYFGLAAAATGPLLTAFGKLAQSKVVSTMFDIGKSAKYMHESIQGLAASKGVSYTKALGETAKSSAAGLVGALNPAILGVTAAVVAGTAVYEAWSSAKAEAAQRTSDLAAALGEEEDTLDATASSIKEALKDWDLTDKFNEAGFSAREFARELRENAGEMDRFRELFIHMGEGLTDIDWERLNDRAKETGVVIPESVRKIKDAVADGIITDHQARQFINAMTDADKASALASGSITADFRDMESAAKDAGVSFAEYKQRFDDASTLEQKQKILDELTAAIDRQSAATDKATDASTKHAKALDLETAGYDALMAAVASTLNPVFGVVEAYGSLQEAQAKVVEAQQKVDFMQAAGKKGTSEYAAAVADLTAANQAQIAAALQTESATQAMVEAVAKGEVNYDAATVAVGNWTREGKITTAQAEMLKKQIFFAAVAADQFSKKTIKGEIKADASQFWATAKGVDEKWFAPKKVQIGTGVFGNPLYEQRAGGGPVRGGQTYIVGEEGPELFTAPQSGTIIPTDQVFGGPGPWLLGSAPGPTQVVLNVAFNGPVSNMEDARRVAALLEQAVASGVPLPRTKQMVGA